MWIEEIVPMPIRDWTLVLLAPFAPLKFSLTIRTAVFFVLLFC
jgi:hypothetical protein